MSELEDRLNSILSDPEQMARIQGLAQSLMGEGGAAPASPSGAAGEADSALLGKLGALEQELTASSAFCQPSHPPALLKSPSLRTCFHLTDKAKGCFLSLLLIQCRLYARC